MSPAKRVTKEPDPASPEADRRRVLDLLDGSRARHEAAHPDVDGDAFAYFAHLSAARQLTEAFYRRALKAHRISDAEFRVVGGLRLRGKGYRTTPLELNEFVQITSAGLTRALDRLEQAGTIERTPNPDDRRSILVGLTREGWAFADALTRDLAAEYDKVLGKVSKRQRKAEVDLLRTVVERLTWAVFD
ncbi:MAG: MarR family transcriptional regulator [Myxococcota bacterium]